MKHIYTWGQPETHDSVREWRDFFDEYEERTGRDHMYVTHLETVDGNENMFNGLLTLPDSESDSYSNTDCKPNGYTVQCREFHTIWIQIPVPTAKYRNGFGIVIRIGIRICECK